MMRKITYIGILLLVGATFVSGCGSTKNSKKKCNGQKAIRTPMGNM
jgi:hypothetical protein